jgi:hypothetical protein
VKPSQFKSLLHRTLQRRSAHPTGHMRSAKNASVA